MSSIIKGTNLHNAINENPHIKQILSYSDSTFLYPMSQFSRKLKNDNREEDYSKKKGHIPSVNTLPKRKLLLLQIEFLTKYAKPDYTVLLCRNKSEDYLPFLILLFPFISKWIISDTELIRTQIKNSRIDYVYNKSYGELINTIKRKYNDKKLLIISDIKMKYLLEEDNKTINKEKLHTFMKEQMLLVDTLNPKKAMLKFLLYWDNSYTTFFDGDLYYSPWNHKTSPETWLTTSGSQKIKYSNRKYDKQLFYFNIFVRTSIFNNDINHIYGIDRCYDCTSEIVIWRNYLYNYNKIPHNILNSMYKNTTISLNKYTRSNACHVLHAFFVKQLTQIDNSRLTVFTDKPSKNTSMNYIINKLIRVTSIITNEFITLGSNALYEQFKQLPIDTTVVHDSQLIEQLLNSDQKLPYIKNKDTIPKNLFQTFYDKKAIPSHINEMVKKYSKGYKYHLYDDKDALIFLKKYFSERVVNRFNDLKIGAHKADLLRYCLLYVYGGVYLDIKTIILKPLDKIFTYNYFYSTISVFEYTIHQGVIASRPNNILFLKLIWYMVNVKLNIVNIGRKNYLSFCRDMYEKIRKDTKLKKLSAGINKGEQDTYYLFEEKCENLLLSDCSIYDNFRNKNKVFITRDPDYPWKS